MDKLELLDLLTMLDQRVRAIGDECAKLATEIYVIRNRVREE